MTSPPIPMEIGRSGERDLQIDWRDGHQSVFPARRLRQSCPCAVCVDELTGVRRLDPDSVAVDIQPASIEVVGRYALRVYWSDGHSSGIYTFNRLRESCPCDECRERASS